MQTGIFDQTLRDAEEYYVSALVECGCLVDGVELARENECTIVWAKAALVRCMNVSMGPGVVLIELCENGWDGSQSVNSCN